MNKLWIQALFCLLVCAFLMMPVVMVKSEKKDLESSAIKTFYRGCGCNQDSETNILPLVKISGSVAVDSTDFFSRPSFTSTPDYFSWRDYEGKDWTTSAKDQDGCAGCYVFPPIGALESAINIREGYAELDPDLSEQYAISCLPYASSITGYGCALGGDSCLVLEYIKNTTILGNYYNGVVLESYFPWVGIDPQGCQGFDCSHDPVLCSCVYEGWQESLIPILNWGSYQLEGTLEDRELIKTLIMEKGPIAASLYVPLNNIFSLWGGINHNPEKYFSYSLPLPFPFDPDKLVNRALCTNHAVLIVGWRDDTSIPNGGYWICKNSWGTFFGYEGFFNIEYGNLRIDSVVVSWVDYDPESIDWLPVANAGELYNGDPREEIIFDGSKSFDAEGPLILYQWDFGDGKSGEGKIITHKYSQEGIYEITLTVMDNKNSVGLDTVVIGIGDSPLKISGGDSLNVVIKGLSNKDLFNVTWSVSPLNGLFYIHSSKREGIIDKIQRNTGYTLTIPFMIGLGPGSIKLSVGNMFETVDFFAIGRYVIIK